MQTLLTATGLSVVRNGRPLLDQVSVSIKPACVSTIIGPNGAGKSTLLRLLANEFRPDSGHVIFLDHPLTDWPLQELALHRAVLPQSSDLNFPFLVEEVVRLGRTPHPGGGNAPEDHAIAREKLAKVGLASFADRYYPSLSGGERQRVHLARVLAQLHGTASPARPRLLLLDEPTASLDIAHQHGVLRLARDLAHREGLAVLVVLHDLNLCLAYADELIALREGRLMAKGAVAETLTPELVSRIFGVQSQLHPAHGDAPAHLEFASAPAADVTGSFEPHGRHPQTV